ncbi:hypothetical protein N7516_011438 [Penicillium verrucosum]|uniref:uncharacterized protein n=1 Tax=Penicillium verrucosum TaxID=60171 RepID=UPI002545BA7C|nr:uncharacterized protein N7516_011438 [Penicillium verrucosum]KAJ5920580.1 hypothetical protein N7516_011438 [Penicillium verrucosum]
MNSTGGTPLFLGIHLEPIQHLRRSSRIAELQIRAAKERSWSTRAQPSQSASRTNQVPRQAASFRCDRSSCDCCSQTIAQSIEMLRLVHNSVDDALELPEGECKELISYVLQASREWIRDLEKQQN